MDDESGETNVDFEVISSILERETTNLRIIGSSHQYHPHLLRLYDVFNENERVHIVTELLTGGDLFDRVTEHKQHVRETGRRKKECRLLRCLRNNNSVIGSSCNDGISPYFTEDEAARLIRNILDAVSYCHDVHFIVHRDLKASNFMFVHPNTKTDVKIIDFGLSRVYFENREQQREYQRRHGHGDEHVLASSEKDLVMGSKVGTPYYVAPEMLTSSHQGYTTKCDVWSVGVISYLILSCSHRLPFLGKDERETVRLLMNDEIDATFPERDWDGRHRSPAAKEFCRSLLTRDPDQRPTARRALQHDWIVSHCGRQFLTTPSLPGKTLSYDSTCSNMSCDLERRKDK